MKTKYKHLENFIIFSFLAMEILSNQLILKKKLLFHFWVNFFLIK
jgi:hypothetical protein